MVPAVSTAAYAAARTHAAVLDRSGRGRLVVSGHDRGTYLQGLLTNDIAALRAGQGCYAAYLTPQGRMIADLLVHEVGDVMLLSLDESVKDTVLARLEQFIFSEDVTLGDVTETFAQIAVIGPAAGAVVSRAMDGVSLETLRALPEHGNLRGIVDGRAVIVTRITDLGEPGLELYVERAHLDSLVSTLAGFGVALLDGETADAIRIEGGVPAFGRDMDQETIPLEAGIESRAISLTKGCYVGQEVIIRVLHRGHGRVARKLVGLTLNGEVAPPAGAVVHSGEHAVGVVTSSTISPALARPIALAYVPRDFLEPGTQLTVAGAGAVVTALPFVTSLKA